MIAARPEGSIRVAPFAPMQAAASLGVFIAAVAVIGVPVDPACAQGRVEATYRATLAGIPIGSGSRNKGKEGWGASQCGVLHPVCNTNFMGAFRSREVSTGFR